MTSKAASISNRKSSLTVAIADDMPEIRILASLWLTEEGHNVVCAGDGRELLRVVHSHKVDLVITDILMPEADGFEVLHAIKRWRPHIRILTISGGGPVMATQDCLRVASALGADAVLTKPFNREQLLSAVERATRNREVVAR